MDEAQQLGQRADHRQSLGRRAVFLAPTQRQLETSRSIDEVASTNEVQDSLRWKVQRWHAGLQRPSRDHYLRCPKTQPSQACDFACPYERAVRALQEPKSPTFLIVQGVGRYDGAQKVSPDDIVASTVQASADGQSKVVSTKTASHSASPPPSSIRSISGLLRNVASPLDSRERQVNVESMAYMLAPPPRRSTSSSSSSSRPKLALGQARQVGISKANRSRRQPHQLALLKTLEAKRQAARQIVQSVPTVATTAHSTSAADRSEPSTESRVTGVTHRTLIDSLVSFDSIPPPPAHTFALSSLTRIADLLASPQRYLTVVQGGRQDGNVSRFSILAVVHRVGCVEEMRNWRGAEGSMMDRSELIVCDVLGNALKVVLEGDCAPAWAGESGRTEGGSPGGNLRRRGRRASKMDGQTMSTSQSLLARRCSARDESLDISNFIAVAPREDQARLLMPVREGDVIALSNLRLTKTNNRRRSKTSARPRIAEQEPDAEEDIVYAVASTLAQHAPSVELCWRNQISQAHDGLVNFDSVLGMFDVRCRAILELAQAWQASS